MSDERTHPTDELQLLLDDQLPADERLTVEAHLRDCSRCRNEFAALREVKTALRKRLPDHEVPQELAARVTRGLAAATAEDAARRGAGPSRRRALLLGAGIAAGLLVGAWILLTRPARPDAVEAAASDFAALQSGRLVLELQTADPRDLEQRFRSAGLPFATRVFDFGMMNYRLLGGQVHRLGGVGSRSALFAYQGDGGEQLVCQMYEGTLESLPSGFEEREHNEIRFRVYQRGTLTLVFWQEGEVVCVLAAEGPPEAAIQLAYAKAVKV